MFIRNIKCAQIQKWWHLRKNCLFNQIPHACYLIFKVLVKHKKMIGGENITQLILTKLPIYLKPKQ